MSLHRAILDGVRLVALVEASPIITWLLAQTTQNSGRSLYIEGGDTSLFSGAGALEPAFADVWYCTC